MKITSKIMAFAVAIVFALTLTACNSYEVPEYRLNRDVRILFGGRGMGTFTLFELTSENTFEVIRFNSGFTQRRDVSAERIFDESILDDFASKSPWLSNILSVDFTENYSHYVRTYGNWGELRLSRRQADIVWDLIENIANNDADRKFETVPGDGRFGYVWAIIDGEMYWSYYLWPAHEIDEHSRFYPFVNPNLMPLAYELIDLSPAPFGTLWPTPSSIANDH